MSFSELSIFAANETEYDILNNFSLQSDEIIHLPMEDEVNRTAKIVATIHSAEDNCNRAALEDNLTGPDWCQRTWDGIHCWPPTPAGQVIEESCSSVLPPPSNVDSYSPAVAFRRCNDSGFWDQGSWTNYSQCLEMLEKENPAVLAVRYITFIGSLLSLVMLLVSLFILIHFRSLECDRLKVHRNLLLALLLEFIAMLIIVEPYITLRHSASYVNLDWLCTGLLTLKMFGQVSSIMWVFVEGLFLHSRLTCNVFDSAAPFKLYYSIGWGIPMMLIGCWCIVMNKYHHEHCWSNYSKVPFIWILQGPMLFALLINLIFLVNIIRILVTKLRTNDSAETIRIKKAVRATLILFQLLGITNLLFAVNPGPNLEAAYMIVNACLQSSQGIIGSAMFCFFNSEVREVVRKRWRQYCIRHMGVTRPPSKSSSYYHYRKSTFSTIVLPATFTFNNKNNQSNPPPSNNTGYYNQMSSCSNHKKRYKCSDYLYDANSKTDCIEMQVVAPEDSSSNVLTPIGDVNKHQIHSGKEYRKDKSISKSKSLLGRCRSYRDPAQFRQSHHHHKQCYPGKTNVSNSSIQRNLFSSPADIQADVYNLDCCVQTICSNETCQAAPCSLNSCVFGDSSPFYLNRQITSRNISPNFRRYFHDSLSDLSVITKSKTHRTKKFNPQTSTL